VAGYVEHPGAERVVEREASPQLTVAARAIAAAIPGEIPVHHGEAKRLTRVTIEPEAKAPGGHPKSVVEVKSPFWHFLEYGTRYNPPYRPIQNAVQRVGLEYETK
jgi:HK97 gp10 family phage protein